MSKSKKNIAILEIDFHTGIGQIIPSTQQAYHKGDFSNTIKRKESEKLKQFKLILGQKIEKDIKRLTQFPTKYEVFVLIIQYFISKNEYEGRDIDNMAKTILDVLKSKFYQDDSQVRTLLIAKKIDRRVNQNFAYIAVKEIKDDRDVNPLKLSGVERSIIYYQELQKQGLV